MAREFTGINDVIHFDIRPLGITISLQWVREGAYTITVYNGEQRLGDLCGAFDTEDAARLVARGYARMYLQEATALLGQQALDACERTATLADLAPAKADRRQPVRTRGVSRAHLADETDPQKRAVEIGRANGGWIPRTRKAGGMELSVLTVLIKRGDADPVYDTTVSRYHVAGIQLRAHMLTDAA